MQKHTTISPLDFAARGQSVWELFMSSESGFYIPRYQRPYAWSEDNIEQLFDDISFGMREWLNSNSDKAVTFLGTIILTNLSDDKSQCMSSGTQFPPTEVSIVVDGQQRLSTIALLSIQLIVELDRLCASFPSDSRYRKIQPFVSHLQARLEKLHKFHLLDDPSPNGVPRIIRQDYDKWAREGRDDRYKSPVSKFISTFINSCTETPRNEPDIPSGEATKAIRATLGEIRSRLQLLSDPSDSEATIRWRDQTFCKKMSSRLFPPDADNFGDLCESITALCNEFDTAPSLCRLLLFSEYLLSRCCVSTMMPKEEDLGVDMFQALNATGMSLTALEVFLPDAITAEKSQSYCWPDSPSKKSMDTINRYIDFAPNSRSTTDRMHMLFQTYSLCYNAAPIGKNFREQRNWTNQTFKNGLACLSDKRDFLHRMAVVANFLSALWYADGKCEVNVNSLFSDDDLDLVKLLIQFLKTTNNVMSARILARFFCNPHEVPSWSSEFVEAAKACAAFLTLWRCVRGTSGLPEVYRTFFSKGLTSKGLSNRCLATKNGDKYTPHGHPISSDDLKRHFWQALENKIPVDKESWVRDSSITYHDKKTVCKFVLLVSGNDRVPDSACPGLTVPGTPGACSLLTFQNWESCYSSLEHVAPQKIRDGEISEWDSEIYKAGLVDHIGNLILLPLDVNKIAGNGEPSKKKLLYSLLAERNLVERKMLMDRAANEGIDLNENARKNLLQQEFRWDFDAILEVEDWNAKLVANRTRHLKEVTYDALVGWLK